MAIVTRGSWRHLEASSRNRHVFWRWRRSCVGVYPDFMQLGRLDSEKYLFWGLLLLLLLLLVVEVEEEGRGDVGPLGPPDDGGGGGFVAIFINVCNYYRNGR